jgi:hypothetical protein
MTEPTQDKDIRALVFGSRTWTDRAAVWFALSRLAPSVVIEGEAKGADTLARQWAQFYRRPVEKFPVDWTREEGRAAGPLRNIRMHKDGRPTIAIGFISGKRGEPYSRGSQHMHDVCGLGGTPCHVRRQDGWVIE